MCAFPSFVGADVAALCREASLQAMREASSDINLGHFQRALRHVTPSGRRGVEVSSRSAPELVPHVVPCLAC